MSGDYLMRLTTGNHYSHPKSWHGHSRPCPLTPRLYIVFPNACFMDVKPKSFQELRDQVQAYCSKQCIQPSEFEDRAGWEIGNFMNAPASVLKAWNLDCLNAICQFIGEPTEAYLKNLA